MYTRNKYIKIAKQKSEFAGKMACYCMYDNEARTRNNAGLWYDEKHRIIDALVMFELVDYKIAYKICDDAWEDGFKNERKNYD